MGYHTYTLDTHFQLDTNSCWSQLQLAVTATTSSHNYNYNRHTKKEIQAHKERHKKTDTHRKADVHIHESSIKTDNTKTEIPTKHRHRNFILSNV